MWEIITKWNWQLILAAGHYLLLPLVPLAWQRIKHYARGFAEEMVQKAVTNPESIALLADSVVQKINGTYMKAPEQRKINEGVDARLKGIEGSLKTDGERREEMHRSNLDRFASIEAAINKKRLAPRRK